VPSRHRPPGAASLPDVAGLWRRERLALAVLVLLVLLLTTLDLAAPQLMPVSALVLPVMVAGWRLLPRSVLVLGMVVAGSVMVALVANPVGRTVVAAVVVAGVVLIAHRYAVLRQRAGLSPGVGLDILVELRDGLRRQGELSQQPDGWTVGRTLRSARGAGMRGDFTLALVREGQLQVVLVDVTGHGPDVAARASQLSGAFGGLLGAVAPDELLPRCNDYLTRRQWRETFATAVHVAVDLASGRGEIFCAGHPAPHLRRADGTWTVGAASGPLLGLHEDARYRAGTVQLAPGDCLLLTSDGLLDPDTDEPIGPLRAAVDRWAGRTVAPVDDALLAGLPVDPADDQSLVLVRRDGPVRPGPVPG